MDRTKAWSGVIDGVSDILWYLSIGIEASLNLLLLFLFYAGLAAEAPALAGHIPVHPVSSSPSVKVVLPISAVSTGKLTTSKSNRVVAISAGNHTCALITDGTIRCWGDNTLGQLGSDPAQIQFSSTPLVVNGVSGAIAISTNYNHTCALLKNSTVTCWGHNGLGQLGRAYGAGSPSYIPTVVTDYDRKPLKGVLALTAGGEHTCALLKNKTVSCWGDNSQGQLGSNPTIIPSSFTPVLIRGIKAVTAISASNNHTCVLLQNGTVSCWGSNSMGQLGRDVSAITPPYVPAAVTVGGVKSLKSVFAISTGEEHSCAALKNNTIRCWGNNNSGQLGGDPALVSSSFNPLATAVLTPSDPSSIVAIDSGKAHSCVLKRSGLIWCWGSNQFTQLGDGSHTAPFAIQPDTFVPKKINVGWDKEGFGKPIIPAIAVDAGDNHTCAVYNDGSVFCWGYNGLGQLGNGGLPRSATPMQVPGVTEVKDANAGGLHTCVVVTDGGVRCWGQNELGQLGNNTTINLAAPVNVLSIGSGMDEIPATLVHAGDYHTCALLKDSSVRCWGYGGYGQLGSPEAPGVSLTPVRVKGIGSDSGNEVPAIALSGGGFFSCAVLLGGTVRCWGRGDAGQLGSAIAQSSMPLTVPGISTATTTSSGHEHTCVVLTDHTVRCWGYNNDGQLGNGTAGSNTESATPITVTGINNAIAIGAGDFHTCAVLKDGTVNCWGDNHLGQLGNGESVSSTIPVPVSGLNNVVAIGAGENHTCVLLGDGAVRCWGDHGKGQLGNGRATVNYSSTPVAVSGISTATAISAGDHHTCVVLIGGTLQCWGSNQRGQLGLATLFPSNRPIYTVGLPK